MERKAWQAILNLLVLSIMTGLFLMLVAGF